jgi:hypothetical protein
LAKLVLQSFDFGLGEIKFSAWLAAGDLNAIATIIMLSRRRRGRLEKFEHLVVLLKIS